MKAHVLIGIAAGLYAWLLCGFRPPRLSSESDLALLKLTAAVVSAFIWTSASIILKGPKLKHWLLWGAASPFVGLPIVLAIAAGPRVGLLDGFRFAVFFGWILIPGGLLMAALAHAISVLALPPLQKTKSGTNR